MALIEVKVPDIGDFDEVSVIELLVKPGDTLAADDPLIVLESDKASMDVPAPFAGVVQSLEVKVGDRLSQGDLILLLTTSVSAPTKRQLPDALSAVTLGPKMPKPEGITPPPPPVPKTPPPPVEIEPAASFAKVHASPAVRRFARELGVDLNRLKTGSGPKNRLLKEDVQAFVKQVMSGAASVSAPAATPSAGSLDLLPWPVVDFAKFGEVEIQPLSRIRKLSAANLARNWVMIPHVTNHDDADITDLEAFRVLTNKENEKSGVKVTMLAFLIKACVAALKKYPEFNSSLDGDALVYKNYWHIGFAADTPNGLVVPVIKDADKKGVLQISQEMGELAKKAREGKLGPADMSGATFTISSLGGIGGKYFTPIINAPEVAILGVCKSTMEPVWDGKAFQPRLMLPLSLTWDHRVIDGAAAARFNAFLGQILSDFRRVLL